MTVRRRIYYGLVALLSAALVVCCASLGVKVSTGTSTGEADKAAEQEPVKWVDFNVPASALEKAYQTALTAHEEELALTMPQVLACLAAQYWGDWGAYRAADADALLERVRAGESVSAMMQTYRDYKYFSTVYEAVLGGMVGESAIELPDETGELRWTERYGLKAYCPLAEGFSFSHSDDFGNSRSYGYRRRHLGNDLMGSVGSPVVAVESGIIEELGWNRYGGWRVGIRSFDGRRYYYYAHLRRGKPYQPGLKEGAAVQAGDVIGYLGMTGYSDTEDVNGMKIPHLHFGMQLIFDESQKDGNGEIWIDVYQLVNFLEKNRSTVQKAEEEGYWERAYRFLDFAACPYLEAGENFSSETQKPDPAK